MEPDHPTPEESETAASEDRSGSNNNTRTYDCTFCKRGFSSAQALGGHMNIHRKDRAKIKHPSNFGQLSLDIPTKIVPSYPTALTSYMSQLAHGGNDGSSPKWQRNLPREEVQRVMTHECAPRQLSLFVETQAGAEDHPSSSSHEWKEEERSGHERGAVEVDLELRLGMEPHHATMSRKEFF